MKATLGNNGSISHHHGVGFWRIQYLEQELGANGIRLLKSIKSALDPEGILNRGKLIDGEREQRG
jgi:alkyldihydroxyacetonephosphate synthase